MQPAETTPDRSGYLQEEAVTTTRPTKRRLAPQLKIFIAAQVFLTLACILTEVYCAYVLHLKDAYTYPFLVRQRTFWDFTLFTARFQHFHHPEFFNPNYFQTDRTFLFMYPAPLAVAFEIFFLYHAHPLRLFLAFIIASVLVASVLLARALHRRGLRWSVTTAFIAASVALAYPLWFDVKQGNIEIVVWSLVTAGIFAFYRGRNYSAATCFGIAGSMKIFPFVYLGLLLSKRKYRETIFAGAVAAFSSLVSLWLLGGSDIRGTWRQIQMGLGAFRTVYMLHLRVPEIGFDHSLFSVYKRFAHHLPPPQTMSHILTGYLAVAAITGLLLYVLRIRHLPTANQVLCLCIASVLLPPVSGDYTLMHLYAPWAILVLFAQDRWNRGEKTPGLLAAFMCFAILLSPESELIHHVARFGGQIKALILVTLFYIALKYPFHAPNRMSTPKTSHPLENNVNRLGMITPPKLVK